MATFPAGVWHDSYTGILTTTGAYRAVYHPFKDGSEDSERVLIAGPGDAIRRVHCPALGGFWLAVENERLIVYYLDTDKAEHREDSGIICGQPVGATTFGGVGPMGPSGGPGPRGEQGERGEPGQPGEPGENAVALTADDIDRIAERVFTLPPAPDHFGLPEYVHYGTRFQEMIAVMVHQAFAQHVLMMTDEGLANLIKSGFQSKVSP